MEWVDVNRARQASFVTDSHITGRPDVKVRCVGLDSERRPRPARERDVEPVAVAGEDSGLAQVSGEVILKPGRYRFQVTVDSRATANFTVEA